MGSYKTNQNQDMFITNAFTPSVYVQPRSRHRYCRQPRPEFITPLQLFTAIDAASVCPVAYRKRQFDEEKFDAAESPINCKRIRLGATTNPENLKVSLDKKNSAVTVESKQKTDLFESVERYQFSLPSDVDVASLRSTLENGVLQFNWESQPKAICNESGEQEQTETDVQIEETDEISAD